MSLRGSRGEQIQVGVLGEDDIYLPAALCDRRIESLSIESWLHIKRDFEVALALRLLQSKASYVTEKRHHVARTPTAIQMRGPAGVAFRSETVANLRSDIGDHDVRVGNAVIIDDLTDLVYVTAGSHSKEETATSGGQDRLQFFQPWLATSFQN